MNTLIVSDVFDAYYEGRRSAPEGGSPKPAEKAPEEKRKPDAANGDRPLSKAA